MKKILVLLVLFTLTVACNAFKDNYDNAPAGGSPVTTLPDGNTAVDFSGDKTVCEVVKGVTVEKAKDAGVITATVLGEDKVTTKAEKVSEFTTKISVLNGDKTAVSFVIKETGEGTFAVCNVTIEGQTVTGGKITIDSFNAVSEKDKTKTINSGSFKFDTTAASATPAIKAMSDLVKADAAASTIFEGTYFTDALVDMKAQETVSK